MDELLKALQEGKKKAIPALARGIFWTRRCTIDTAQVSEFESYAPCKINAFRVQSTNGWLLFGTILYGGKLYSID